MRSTFVSEAGLLIAFEKTRERLSKCCSACSAVVRLSLLHNNFVYTHAISLFVSSFFEVPGFPGQVDLKCVIDSFYECKLV